MSLVDATLEEIKEMNPLMANQRIRVDQKTQQVSVIDVIRMVTGCASADAGKTLTRLEGNLEQNAVTKLRINNKGRITPVCSIQTCKDVVAMHTAGARIDRGKKRKIAQALGVTGPLMRDYIEPNTISRLVGCFSFFSPVTQYTVGEHYRIDLYLVNVNVAIECDENGHSSYNPVFEGEREAEIKEALPGVHFIRYNPMADDWTLEQTVARVFNFIFNNKRPQ